LVVDLLVVVEGQKAEVLVPEKWDVVVEYLVVVVAVAVSEVSFLQEVVHQQSFQLQNSPHPVAVKTKTIHRSRYHGTQLWRYVRLITASKEFSAYNFLLLASNAFP
jgi:hypothetical protein